MSKRGGLESGVLGCLGKGKLSRVCQGDCQSLTISRDQLSYRVLNRSRSRTESSNTRTANWMEDIAQHPKLLQDTQRVQEEDNPVD